MTRSVFFYFLLPLVLFTSSCKKPKASFNIDKTVYSAGDEISIDDNSNKLKSYAWTLKGPGYERRYQGTMSSLRLNPSMPDGIYSLGLMSYDKKEILRTCTASFIVKTVRGSLVLANPSSSDITITANNGELATIPARDSKDLNMAIGVWYLVASNGKTHKLHIEEGKHYSWSITQ